MTYLARSRPLALVLAPKKRGRRAGGKNALRHPARACAMCTQDFWPKQQRSRFCSRKCESAAAQPRTPDRKCACGANIWRGRQTCCVACSAAKKRALGRVVRTRTCNGCGEQFVRSRSGANKGKYCTRACAFAHPKWRPVRPRTAVRSCKVYFPACDMCGDLFTARFSNSRVCTSDACRREQKRLLPLVAAFAARLSSRPHAVACAECGVAYTPLKVEASDFCTSACGRRVQRRKRRHLERARLRGVRSERVDARIVHARDNGHCRLCRGHTPWALRGTCNFLAPEVDHIIPLSRGGADTYDNVQLLCRTCNGLKGAATMEEFMVATSRSIQSDQGDDVGGANRYRGFAGNRERPDWQVFFPGVRISAPVSASPTR